MLQRSTGRQIRKRSPTLGEPYRHPDLKGRIGKSQLTHLVGTNRYRTKVTMTVTGSQSQADKSPGKEIRRSREMAPRANPKHYGPEMGNIETKLFSIKLLVYYGIICNCFA